MTPMNRHPHMPIFISAFVLILSFQHASADSVKILEWNISGNELNGNITNQNAAAAIFDSENADIITLQETSSGADEIATILAANYVLAVAIDGQEIWIKSGERFQIDSTGSWAGLCNNRSLDGATVSLRDLNSDDSRLYIYSAHFCIPDTFAGDVDINPSVSNEDQQEHLCNIIDELEANAALGVVLIGADFNDINIPAGESLIRFLEGAGTVVPEPNHNGQTGAPYIVIAYEGDLFFKDTSDAFITWNGELDSLGAYREGIALEASIGIDVFDGQLQGLRGSLEIFFAYSVEDILYYNPVPVSLEIENNPR